MSSNTINVLALKNYILLILCISLIIIPFIIIFTVRPLEETLESITIEKSYEISISDHSDFSYLLIPTGDLGDLQAHDISIFLETSDSSILIWQETIEGIKSPYKEYQLVTDGTGTPWLNITLNHFNVTKNNEFFIQVQTTRREGNPLYKDNRVNESYWLEPSRYIDSDNQLIIDKAKNLTLDCLTRIEKSKKIMDFVSINIKYNPNKSLHYVFNSTYSGEVDSSASDVLRNKDGVCYHFSRLFVALCRAIGIPARTINGLKIEGKTEVGRHSWCEFLDKENYWHVVEPQIDLFEVMPPSYFNLIHGPNQDKSFHIERFFTDGYVLGDEDSEEVFNERNAVCTDYDFRVELSHTFSLTILISLILGEVGAFGLGLLLSDWNNKNEKVN